MSETYSWLMDSNGTVLTVSPYTPVIVFLKECTSDSTSILGVNFDDTDKPFPLKNVTPEEYPEWTYISKKRTFTKGPVEPSSEVRKKAALAHAKSRAIGSVMFGLNTMTFAVGTGILIQESIYAAKKAQAVAFKELNYDETRLHEFPYVLQYANFAQISGKKSADDIIFSAKLDEQIMMQVELLRLTYFNKIKKAQNTDEIQTLMTTFFDQIWGKFALD